MSSVEETKIFIQNQNANSEDASRTEKTSQKNLQAEYERVRKAMIMRHRQERAELLKRQEERRIAENKIRAARLPTGLKGLWFRITGGYQRIKELNEIESAKSRKSSELELQALLTKQNTQKYDLLNHKKRKLLQQSLMKQQ